MEEYWFCGTFPTFLNCHPSSLNSSPAHTRVFADIGSQPFESETLPISQLSWSPIYHTGYFIN